MHEPVLPVLSLWSARPEAPTGRFPSLPERLETLSTTAEDALAKARQRFPGRDVLVCAADACWTGPGWARFWSAWTSAPAATVLSALDASIFARPDGRDDEAMADACWAWAEHAAFPVGFHSRRASLWRAGTAAMGVGSEAPEGAHCLPCVWVGAAAPVTMAPEVIWHGLVTQLQDRLREHGPGAFPRLDRNLPVVLHVLHAWGGGIERFARDLAAADTQRQHLLLVARGDDHLAPLGRYFDLHDDLDRPPLRRWALADPVADVADRSPELARFLQQVVSDWGVGAVLVSSLVGHSLEVLRTGLPTTWCAHDAYPFWPSLHDLPAGDADAVSDAGLAARIAREGDSFRFSQGDPSRWRRLRHATRDALISAHASLVWPSESARKRFVAMVPGLSELPGHVIAPATPAWATDVPWRPDPRRPLRVLMPGHLEGSKGERLLAQLLPLLDANIELIALGCGTAAAERLAADPRITVHAAYRREDLPSWIAGLQPDIAMLPSTIPETWSYVYSEMCAFGIPTLCPAIGALRDRVSDSGFGWLAEPEPEAFAERLNALAADRGAVAAARERPRPRLPSPADMARAWQAAMPVMRREPTLGVASPDRIGRLGDLGQGLAARRLRDQLAAGNERLTAWARALETELRESRDALRETQDALRENEDALREKQDALRESHDTLREVQDELRRNQDKLRQAYGLYERDTNDLARQRDTALHLRDSSDAEIARLLSSRSWRLTRPLRGAKRLFGKYLASLKYRFRRLASFARRAQNSIRTRGLRQGWLQWRARKRHQRANERTSAILPGGQQSVELGALELPDIPTPRASIVIPVYNQLALTLDCLRSLAASGDTTGFEVIIVDDCSKDGTAEHLPGIPGLRYLRNAKNLGFIGACNAGAAIARGEYLVFLNNDTLVQHGWLDALLATFADHPDTGLAGSKLVYPSGRLQEAGGIVFSDGTAWNYGRLEDAAEPRFNFVREADYCSGAAIAISRLLFEELNGFDTLYAPAYYEDTDLAMRVRAHGLKVRYQPASVVVHLEGATAGTDLSKGMKAYQVENQKKFLARWRTPLASTHPSPRSAGNIDRAANHRKRHRVLVVDACTPTPDRDSGSMRILELMRVLVELGCAVTFFADNHAHDGRYTTDLQRFGILALWGQWLGDVPKWLEENGGGLDIVIVSRHYVMGPLLPLLRQYAPQARIVFDTVDLHFLREEREAEQSGNAIGKMAAGRTRDNELRLVKRSDVTWVVSQYEKKLLADLVPGATVDVVSNIHGIHTGTPELAGRQDLIFVGGYRHPPNIDAARWLAEEIFPRVRAQRPSARLHLVGGDAPPEVAALGDREGIVFHGHVADLDALLDATRVGLAPLRYGAGVKGKVNQYLSRGLPTVATPCAVEGMHLVDEQDALIADDAGAFANSIVRLLDDDALWHALRKAGWANTRRYFSRDAAAAAILPLLESLPVR